MHNTKRNAVGRMHRCSSLDLFSCKSRIFGGTAAPPAATRETATVHWRAFKCSITQNVSLRKGRKLFETGLPLGAGGKKWSGDGARVLNKDIGARA